MGKAKKLYTFVDADDSTPVQKLPILDQLRLLLKEFTYDAANELKAEDAVTHEYMTLKANLSAFLHQATEPIRSGQKKEVIVNLSNMFDPVLNDVLNSAEIANYYHVSIARPEIDYDIPYDFLLRLRVKES